MDTQGDVIIPGLWDRQNVVIIEVKLGDADAATYRFESMSALLAQWEKINKDKHGKHCHKQQYFSSFFLSMACNKGKTCQSCGFESTHGSKNRSAHFARARMD